MKFFVLLSIFRMVVLPVQFEDRKLQGTHEEHEALLQQAEAYFERQFAPAGQAFSFELGPTVTLAHPVSWYGANYPDRKDIRLADAVREACLAANGQVNFSLYDNDNDGSVDNVFLLFPGPGEHSSGDEGDIYPQQGRLTADGTGLALDGRVADRYAVAHEGEPGVFCHEFCHVLGLPDLYDTDGAESGGLCPGLWGTSLLDDGCRLQDFPEFGAVEYDLLGLGRCEAARPGSYTLEPLAAGQRYLRAESDRKDEYFLFEARAGGLYVYHIDRSDNPAGYSTRQQAELTAAGRWEVGEVNNNPAHPCARLIPADPAATDASRLPFGAVSASFGSDTPSAFRAWSGAATGLALTGIRPAAAGAVTFDVIRPIVLAEPVAYQDAALVRWSVDPALGPVQAFEVSWSDGTAGGSAELAAGTTSYTIEHLQPRTEYIFSVQVRCSETERYTADGRFSTKFLRKGTFPYIYLGSATRNLDGSFPAGSQIPLRVYNASDVQNVRWTLDGRAITPDADGFYTLRQSGVLRAQIEYADGTSETLLKEIIVQ